MQTPAQRKAADADQARKDAQNKRKRKERDGRREDGQVLVQEWMPNADSAMKLKAYAAKLWRVFNKEQT